ncbi:MAG: hypothetical protein COB67_03455 [SAR324 cluster bacterium]|uniref:Uncharacterized protein n=1 Tax=SAR324 cluster bacterium TaxID=2024889 RepID=A0A2A4T8I6_9DELT|nr:MAG: hypothetical protein COB67_03455 [SAR324 cluster bacterium]
MIIDAKWLDQAVKKAVKEFWRVKAILYRTNDFRSEESGRLPFFPSSFDFSGSIFDIQMEDKDRKTN